MKAKKERSEELHSSTLDYKETGRDAYAPENDPLVTAHVLA